MVAVWWLISGGYSGYMTVVVLSSMVWLWCGGYGSCLVVVVVLGVG